MLSKSLCYLGSVVVQNTLLSQERPMKETHEKWSSGIVKGHSTCI